MGDSTHKRTWRTVLLIGCGGLVVIAAGIMLVVALNWTKVQFPASELQQHLVPSPAASPSSCAVALLVLDSSGKLVEAKMGGAVGAIPGGKGELTHRDNTIQWHITSVNARAAIIEVTDSRGEAKTVEIETGTSRDVKFDGGRMGVRIKISGLRE